MKTCNPEQNPTQQLIFPPNSRPSDFQDGTELGKDWERQRIAAYFHDQLAPDLMALAFSIEAIRSELESEKHPAEAKLKDIRDRVSKMLQPIRQNILDLVENRQQSASKPNIAVQTIRIELGREADLTPGWSMSSPRRLKDGHSMEEVDRFVDRLREFRRSSCITEDEPAA
jgi:Histidine kinase